MRFWDRDKKVDGIAFGIGEEEVLMTVLVQVHKAKSGILTVGRGDGYARRKGERVLFPKMLLV
jgi:hypothetical protein